LIFTKMGKVSIKLRLQFIQLIGGG